MNQMGSTFLYGSRDHATWAESINVPPQPKDQGSGFEFNQSSRSLKLQAPTALDKDYYMYLCVSIGIPT